MDEVRGGASQGGLNGNKHDLRSRVVPTRKSGARHGSLNANNGLAHNNARWKKPGIAGHIDDGGRRVQAVASAPVKSIIRTTNRRKTALTNTDKKDTRHNRIQYMLGIQIFN